MAKLPSLVKILNAVKITFLRFPLETISAICGSIFAILLIDRDYSESGEFFQKGVMACFLCLVLFLSISLFFETAKKNNMLRFATSLVLGSVGIAFVFSFQKEISDVEVLQFLVLNIALHLLVSFAGFLPKNYNQEEFWEFNKQLFLRILTSALYSGVLYAGLSLAILAVDQLFNVDVDYKIYGYLFFIIAGIFNTVFFLSGVPETHNAENLLVLNYPKGLKNFTQYILMPLISIYLVILLCYETKILVTLSLPVGWVSYLVLVFAIFGILSFLLVHPIATETGNLWMRTFNRWFYFLLVPLLGLLFWAILYRIQLYGFTHDRYYVLLLAIWLAVVVAYFLIRKQPRIRFIPISMCLAGLFSIAGPQSADSVSKHSQLSRFEAYMQMGDGKKLTFEQEQDLSSIVTFLERNYGVGVMVPYSKNKLEALIKKDKDPYPSDIMKALGFQYRSEYDRKDKANTDISYYYNENSYQNRVENIHGYDMSFLLSKNDNFECKDCIAIDGTKYTIKSKDKSYGTDLQINNDVIPLKINEFIDKNSDFEYQNPDKKITQKIETSKYDIAITYISLNGKKTGNKKIIDQYQIRVMVKIKQ